MVKLVPKICSFSLDLSGFGDAVDDVTATCPSSSSNNFSPPEKLRCLRSGACFFGSSPSIVKLRCLTSGAWRFVVGVLSAPAARGDVTDDTELLCLSIERFRAVTVLPYKIFHYYRFIIQRYFSLAHVKLAEYPKYKLWCTDQHQYKKQYTPFNIQTYCFI